MTVERDVGAAAAPGRMPGPESGPEFDPGIAGSGPPLSSEYPPLDPDHPQWVRRRRRLTVMFGASLATFLGVGVAAIANMVRGLPIDPHAASVMWPLGSAAAACAGIHVWQGVRRSDAGTRWQYGRRDSWQSGRQGAPR